MRAWTRQPLFFFLLKQVLSGKIYPPNQNPDTPWNDLICPYRGLSFIVRVQHVHEIQGPYIKNIFLAFSSLHLSTPLNSLIHKSFQYLVIFLIVKYPSAQIAHTLIQSLFFQGNKGLIPFFYPVGFLGKSNCRHRPLLIVAEQKAGDRKNLRSLYAPLPMAAWRG